MIDGGVGDVGQVDLIGVGDRARTKSVRGVIHFRYPGNLVVVNGSVVSINSI